MALQLQKLTELDALYNRVKLSNNTDNVEHFHLKFHYKVIELKLYPDQVYSADESGLFWKVLSKKTLINKNKDCAPGWKLAKSNNRYSWLAWILLEVTWGANGSHAYS